MLDITFYGVRGSTPCSGPTVARYGGNTSCVVIEVPGEAPIICDLGTGLRDFGTSLAGSDGPFRATALVTHLHWDHIQGLPFFAPVLAPGAELGVIGPVQADCSLAEAFSAAIGPPMFPVPLEALPGRIRFEERCAARFPIGSAQITAFPVPHVGPTNGYRIEAGGVSMAYVSDHQQPVEVDGQSPVPPGVVEQIRGVDLLVHDAQYDPGEFARKSTWGHCTVSFAVEVAKAAEVGRLVLYHHDPLHDDAWIDQAAAEANRMAGDDLEVVAASQGMAIRLAPDEVDQGPAGSADG